MLADLIKQAATKTAKSKLIKVVEAMLEQARGPFVSVAERKRIHAKAMGMLTKAEESQGLGSYAAREIKGLQQQLGRGQQGVVQTGFYGGDMVPTKKIRRGQWGAGHWAQKSEHERLESLLRESENSLEVSKLVREDPTLRRVAVTPEYHGMHGLSEGGLKGRVQRALDAGKHVTKRQAGEADDAHRRFLRSRQGDHPLAGQTMVMDWLRDPPPASKLVPNQTPYFEGNVNIARRRLSELGYNLTDLHEGNVWMAPDGRAQLFDFGIVNPFKEEGARLLRQRPDLKTQIQRELADAQEAIDGRLSGMWPSHTAAGLQTKDLNAVRKRLAPEPKVPPTPEKPGTPSTPKKPGTPSTPKTPRDESGPGWWPLGAGIAAGGAAAGGGGYYLHEKNSGLKVAYELGAKIAVEEYASKLAGRVDAPNYGPSQDMSTPCSSCRHFDVRVGTSGFCTKYDFMANGNYTCTGWNPVKGKET